VLLGLALLAILLAAIAVWVVILPASHTPPPTPIPVTVTPSPEPVHTPWPTASASKVIPRNATYNQSQPPLTPPTLDKQRNYTLSFNPPFNDSTVLVRKGTIFEVSGKTDLPVGTELEVQIGAQGSTPTGVAYIPPKEYPIDTIFDKKSIRSSQRGERTWIGGYLYVEPGCTPTKSSSCSAQLNTWRFIIDSYPLRPDEYIVTMICPATSAAHTLFCVGVEVDQMAEGDAQ